MNIQKTKNNNKTNSAPMIYRERFERETIVLPLEAYLESYQLTTMTLFCENK